jgi:ubiquinone/menaquinone biosynthesis C-methylase UbiE
MVQVTTKVAFIFWASNADPAKHRVTVSVDSMELIVVGVKDYDQAVEVSQTLLKEGTSAIELCGGFGNIGVARVAEAVKGVPVGVVKFDIHPLLQGKSGDQIFGFTP